MMAQERNNEGLPWLIRKSYSMSGFMTSLIIIWSVEVIPRSAKSLRRLGFAFRRTFSMMPKMLIGGAWWIIFPWCWQKFRMIRLGLLWRLALDFSGKMANYQYCDIVMKKMIVALNLVLIWEIIGSRSN